MPNFDYLIEIPAAEFTHSSPRIPSRPPPRLLRPRASPSPRATYDARQRTAAAHRQASINSLQTRCNAHVTHVVTVARAVHQTRRDHRAQRRVALRDQLLRADLRRSSLRTARFASKLPSQDRPFSPASVVVGLTASAAAGNSLEAACRFSASLPCGIVDGMCESPDTPHLRPRHAAAVLASHYLLAKARRILSYAGLMAPAFRRISFEELSARLQTEYAMSAADLIMRAIRIHPATSPSIKAHTTRSVEGRVLLSGLLIALHPQIVVQVASPHCSDQPSSAPRPFDEFTILCSRKLVLSLHVASPSALANLWPLWRSSFRAWKTRDCQDLVTTLITDAVELENMRNPIASDLSALQQIASVTSVLQGESREGFSSPDLDSTNHSKQDWEKAVEQRHSLIRETIVALAGSKGNELLDTAIRTSRELRQEQTVHQILVNIDGYVAAQCERTAVPPSAWTTLQTELSKDEPEYTELAVRLAFVARLLNSMRPNVFSIPQKVDAVDLSFALQVVDAIFEACRACQASAFDALLSVWAEHSSCRLQGAGHDLAAAVTEVLKEGTEIVGNVFNAVLIFRLHDAVPTISEVGATWELTRFSDRVANGQVNARLPRTRRWLRDAAAKARSGESGIIPGEGRDVDELDTIMTVGVAALGTRSQKCEDEVLPEFFQMDLVRFVKIQNDVQRCGVVAGLDNVAREFARARGGHINNTSGTEELLELTGREDVRLADMENCFVRWVGREIGSLSKSEEDLLRRMVLRIATAEDRTFELMCERVRHVIINGCLRRYNCECDGGSEFDINEMRGLGLVCVRDLAKGIIDNAYVLVSHALNVYGEVLDRMLLDLDSNEPVKVIL